MENETTPTLQDQVEPATQNSAPALRPWTAPRLQYLQGAAHKTEGGIIPFQNETAFTIYGMHGSVS